MRLIDADTFMEYLGLDTGVAREENLGVIVGTEDLDRQPTAYDVDKVVDLLEQQKKQYIRRAEEIENKFSENYESQKNYGKACSYDHAIEIVKSGGIE